MAPIARNVVKLTQKIRDPVKRNLTLKLTLLEQLTWRALLSLRSSMYTCIHAAHARQLCERPEWARGREYKEAKE